MFLDDCWILPNFSGALASESRWDSGARDESRTRDLRFTRAVLYQLSYPGDRTISVGELRRLAPMILIDGFVGRGSASLDH